MRDESCTDSLGESSRVQFQALIQIICSVASAGMAEWRYIICLFQFEGELWSLPGQEKAIWKHGLFFFLLDNWTDCMRLSFPAVLPGQQAELFLTIHCLQSGCKWPEFLTGDSNGVHFFFRLCTPWLWQEWLYRMLSAGLWPQLDCWKAIWGSLKWDLFGHCLVLTFKMFCWFLHYYQNGRK